MVKQFISEIIPDSAASNAGIKPGEYVLSINDEPLLDIIDYQYFSSLEKLTIKTEDANGKIRNHFIRKQSWENIGIIFRDDLLGHVMNCANNCIFCFISQMPPNMRETLYVEDDDWRMSLIMGNYITMTNLSDREFDRIIRRRVSPLYISVHATDPLIRSEMLQNKNASNIMNRLQKLYDNQISFHCQIVLCPGWNDGEVLNRTIRELYSFQPYARSVAIVPVGLTRFRDNLPVLKPVNASIASSVIDFAEEFGEKAFRESGTHFVFASDEMYMLASRKLPEYSYYEDFPQIENGVGLCAKLFDEYAYAKELYHCTMPPDRKVTIATGTSAAGFLEDMIDDENVRVIPIKNRFFGESITVAGLVTGTDLINQLSGYDLGSILLLSCSMLREGNDVFLDDILFSSVEKELGIETKAVQIDGIELYKAIYGIEEEFDDEE